MKQTHKQDNSFIISKNSLPYHVTKDMGEYASLLEEYTKNPSAFEEEKIEKTELSYQEKRALEYPNLMSFIDAQVKINSGVETLISEGQSQLNDYITKCLEVKNKYPKE